MTPRLSYTAEKARMWTARRDEEIRKAAAGGMTLRAIAREVGMVHSGVSRVLERGPKESTAPVAEAKWHDDHLSGKPNDAIR